MSMNLPIEKYNLAEGVLYSLMKQIIQEIALCSSGGGTGRAGSYASSLVTANSALLIVQELRALEFDLPQEAALSVQQEGSSELRYANPEQYTTEAVSVLTDPEGFALEHMQLSARNALQNESHSPLASVAEQEPAAPPKRGAPPIDKNGDDVVQRLAKARAARQAKIAEEKQALQEERKASRRAYPLTSE